MVHLSSAHFCIFMCANVWRWKAPEQKSVRALHGSHGLLRQEEACFVCCGSEALASPVQRSEASERSQRVNVAGSELGRLCRKGGHRVDTAWRLVPPHLAQLVLESLPEQDLRHP